MDNKVKIALIVLGMLFCLKLGGCNAERRARFTEKTQIEMIDSLERKVSAMDSTISAQAATIMSQSAEMDGMRRTDSILRERIQDLKADKRNLNQNIKNILEK